jgi:hypothetical protein
LEISTQRTYERINRELDKVVLGSCRILETNTIPNIQAIDPNAPYDEDEFAAPLFEWASNDPSGGLPDLMKGWDEEVDMVIGSQL